MGVVEGPHYRPRVAIVLLHPSMASPELTAALESVADSSAAVKTRTYNDLLNQLTNAPPASAVEHAANLMVYIDAVLSSSLGIINIRPILASIIKSLSSVPAEVKVKGGKHIADALQSQLASYEEQDAAVREILAQGYARLEIAIPTFPGTHHGLTPRLSERFCRVS